MYYLLYLTERCNLACAYCDSVKSRERFTQEIAYPIDALIDFLARDPEVALQFYGGEPLLRTDLMQTVIERARPKRVVVQTNGLLLDRIAPELLAMIDLISVSLDGPPDVTDRGRGEGVYAKAVAQAQALRTRGFKGRVDVRMTLSPGMRVYEAVHHFVDGCAFRFDGIYWQLNVQFHEIDWRRDRRFLTRWVRDAYNPQVTRLVDEWAQAIARDRRLYGIIPFAELTHDLLTGDRVKGVRCSAGDQMWTVDTNGDVFPCPVMRGGRELAKGSITLLDPQTLPGTWTVGSPCDQCEILGLCGGRCLCANHQKRWGEEGFALVCETVKHLVRELTRVAPTIEGAIADGAVRLEDLAIGDDYEVIP
jgi:uncharacterized protein